jgi:hypothetical protein
MYSQQFIPAYLGSDDDDDIEDKFIWNRTSV